MSNNIENMPFATELLSDKEKNEKRLWKAVFIEFGVIICLIIAIIGICIYHDYKWSLTESVVVDTGLGDGNATFVGGDNTGGVYNGKDSGEKTQANQKEK